MRFFNYEAAFSYYQRKVEGLKRCGTLNSGVKNIAKPVLLLAVIQGVDEGRFATNCFVYDEVVELYDLLFTRYFIVGRQTNHTSMAMPYYYLQTDGFWHFAWQENGETSVGSPYAGWLRRNVRHAYLDRELWVLIQHPDYRSRFARFIIDTQIKMYFRESESKVAEGGLLRLLSLLIAM